MRSREVLYVLQPFDLSQILYFGFTLVMNLTSITFPMYSFNWSFTFITWWYRNGVLITASFYFMFAFPAKFIYWNDDNYGFVIVLLTTFIFHICRMKNTNTQTYGRKWRDSAAHMSDLLFCICMHTVNKITKSMRKTIVS